MECSPAAGKVRTLDFWRNFDTGRQTIASNFQYVLVQKQIYQNNLTLPINVLPKTNRAANIRGFISSAGLTHIRSMCRHLGIGRTSFTSERNINTRIQFE